MSLYRFKTGIKTYCVDLFWGGRLKDGDSINVFVVDPKYDTNVYVGEEGGVGDKADMTLIEKYQPLIWSKADSVKGYVFKSTVLDGVIVVKWVKVFWIFEKIQVTLNENPLKGSEVVYFTRSARPVVNYPFL